MTSETDKLGEEILLETLYFLESSEGESVYNDASYGLDVQLPDLS